MIIADSDPSSPIAKSSQGATTITSPSVRTDSESSFQPLIPPPTYTDACGPMAEPAGPRFVKAFIVAVGVYLLSAAVIGSLFVPENVRYKWGPTPEPEVADGTAVSCHLPLVQMLDLPRYALPWQNSSADATETVIQQGSGVAMHSPPYAAKTTFTLPGNAPLHFFFSRGSLASGIIRFVPGDANDTYSKHVVKGEVITRYWSLHARDRANLCIVKRDEGAYGFGILTPNGWRVPREEMLSFEVTITLPPRDDLSRASGALETDMNNFAHDVMDLSSNFFTNADFSSSNMPAKITSLHAQSAKIKTSNAGITGTFNVTDTLDLITSNAIISTRINAFNRDWHKPTDVHLVTSNSLLSTEISLSTPESDNQQFKSTETGLRLDAITSNGRLDLRIPSAPLDSHIQVNAHTSNANSFLGLPPTFEGKLSLGTSGYSAAASVLNSPTEDPSGRGLKRTFNRDRSTRGMLEGRVWWGPEKDHRELGSAMVKTSNGENVVQLY